MQGAPHKPSVFYTQAFPASQSVRQAVASQFAIAPTIAEAVLKNTESPIQHAAILLKGPIRPRPLGRFLLLPPPTVATQSHRRWAGRTGKCLAVVVRM